MFSVSITLADTEEEEASPEEKSKRRRKEEEKENLQNIKAKVETQKECGSKVLRKEKNNKKK